MALQQLQELVSQPFAAGTDGTNAVESLKGIIDDPELHRSIQAMAAEDSNADVRPQIQEWLESNAPEALDQLDFGDITPPEVTPSPAEEPQLADHDPEQQSQGKMNVQELAEFIHTFYDKQSGTFPKGPEGVAIMVGKKYGEQAEHVARKMVERMAPQQTDNSVNELARIRQLSGM
jgi:hypothetical protein